MPYYDLRCEACSTEFNLKGTIQERSGKLLSCPACGSHELATVYKKVNILKFKGKDCDICPGAAMSGHHGCCRGGSCNHH